MTDLHYYRHHQSRIDRTKGKNYVLVPFLFFLILIFCVILIYQIFTIFMGSDKENIAKVNIISGKVYMTPWGEADDVLVFNGQKVFVGDEIYASNGAKASLDFGGDLIVRIDSSSRMSVNNFDEEKKALNLKLELGNLWLNNLNANNLVEVDTGNLMVTNKGAIVAVSKASDEIVRVLKNEVDVNVYNNSDITEIVESVKLGVGQMVKLSPDTLTTIKSKEYSGDLKVAIDDSFKNSNWFNFNYSEDKTLNLGIEENNNESSEKLAEEVLTDSTDVADSTDLGEVGDNNESNIEAITELGGDTSEVINTNSVLTEEESSLAAGELEPPSILSYNGTANNTVEATPVLLLGNVDKRATAIVVDGYRLKLFKKGTGRWTYIAKEEFDNIKPGLNTYKVYAEDENGNKSTVSTFTITYNKKEEPKVKENEGEEGSANTE